MFPRRLLCIHKLSAEWKNFTIGSDHMHQQGQGAAMAT
jgi:hypothetical protein